MAVRLASDAIRTLYAIQSVTKDVKHMWTKLPADSIPHETSPAEKLNQEQQNSISSDSALVHKVHPSDRPLRNDVQERAKCTELDDILAKWNVHKPKK